MQLRLLTLAPLLAVALLGSATGCPAGDDAGLVGEGGAGGDGDAATSPNDDLARLAVALCDHQAACECSTVGDAVGLAECEQLHEEGLRRMGLATQDSEAYAFDAECLRELADCWEQLECEAPFADPYVGGPCDLDCAVHQRNLERGSACESEPYQLLPLGFASECAPGLSCLGGHGYSVCDTPASLQVGDDCFGGAHHRSCASELYCRYGEAGQGTCQPRVGDGDACEEGTCIRGLRCEAGLCVPRGAVGEQCESRSDCGESLWCHFEDGVCVDDLPIGETCRFPDDPNDDLLPCVAGVYCGDENCEAKREAGSPCTAAYECLGQSSCDNGVCTTCEALGNCPDAPICNQIPYTSSYPREE